MEVLFNVHKYNPEAWKIKHGKSTIPSDGDNREDFVFHYGFYKFMAGPEVMLKISEILGVDLVLNEKEKIALERVKVI